MNQLHQFRKRFSQNEHEGRERVCVSGVQCVFPQTPKVQIRVPNCFPQAVCCAIDNLLRIIVRCSYCVSVHLHTKDAYEKP